MSDVDDPNGDSKPVTPPCHIYEFTDELPTLSDLSISTCSTASDIAGPSSKRSGGSKKGESKFTVTKNLNDEDPDDSELSAEAKAVVLKREKEKERLRKLGKMIPVSTSVESVPAMETYSRTTPFRLIHKDSEYSLYTVKSSSDDLPRRASRRSAMSSNARSSAATSDSLEIMRPSQSVAFGVVEEAEIEGREEKKIKKKEKRTSSDVEVVKVDASSSRTSTRSMFDY